MLRRLLDIRLAIALALAVSAAAFVLALTAYLRVDSLKRPFSNWNRPTFGRAVRISTDGAVPKSSPSGEIAADDEVIQQILDNLKAPREYGDDGMIIWRPFDGGFQSQYDCPPVCRPSGKYDYL